MFVLWEGAHEPRFLLSASGMDKGVFAIGCGVAVLLLARVASRRGHPHQLFGGAGGARVFGVISTFAGVAFIVLGAAELLD